MYRFGLFFVILMSFFASSGQAEETSKAYFYTGDYSMQWPPESGVKVGISLWSVNLETGRFKREADTQVVRDPGFLVLNSDKSRLYSVARDVEKGGGFINTYAVDPKTHALTKLASISAEGSSASYLSIDATGNNLLSAHYGRGVVRVNPILPDGTVGAATANVQHSGSSVNEKRQNQAHPHAAVLSLDNQYVFVPDLGLDQIKAYSFDADKGTLTAEPKLDVTTLPGFGPRHLIFHPSGKFAFCGMEMGNSLVSYRYADGQLSKVGDYLTVPERMKGESSTSEVRVHPNGKFVYIANRGNDTIAVFKLDETTGTLERIQLQILRGNIPRNFGIDPSGTMMVVGHKKSDSMESLHVNPDTGLLTPTGHQVPINAPSYICFK